MKLIHSAAVILSVFCLPSAALAQEAMSVTDPARAGYTVGGGIENAFADNWSVKLEYLFMDYGSISATGSGAPITTTTFNGPRIETIAISTTTAALSTRVTDNIARLSLNYRFAP